MVMDNVPKGQAGQYKFCLVPLKDFPIAVENGFLPFTKKESEVLNKNQAALGPDSIIFKVKSVIPHALLESIKWVSPKN